MADIGMVVGFLVGIILVLLWAFQFVQMMLLEDTDFPGRYDKILWLVTFITFFFIAPFLFMAWKNGIKHYRQAERRERDSR